MHIFLIIYTVTTYKPAFPIKLSSLLSEILIVVFFDRLNERSLNEVLFAWFKKIIEEINKRMNSCCE